MVQTRLFLVAMLTLTVPMHAVAAVASELCIVFSDRETGSTLAHDHAAGPGSAHDHAAHDHPDKDASDAVHCGPCATAFIPAAPKLFVPAVPEAAVASPLLPTPGSVPPRRLDRPPLAP